MTVRRCREDLRRVFSGPDVARAEYLRCQLPEDHPGNWHVHDTPQNYARWKRIGGRYEMDHVHLNRNRGGPPAGMPTETWTNQRLFPWRTPNRAMQLEVKDGRLRPIADQVEVLPDPEQEQHHSGLVLPPSARDHRRAQSGTVLAVGPKVLDLRPGDRVLYRQWGGVEITVDGKLHILLRAHKSYLAEDPDLFAIIKEAA